MYRQVLAFDFDGTLAHHGQVSPALQTALKQLQQRGFALFLATGRQYGTLDLGQWSDVFSGIVWENGAVLTIKDLDDLYLPFGLIDNRLVKGLEAADIPLEYGVAIVATQAHYEETIWHVLTETSSEAAVVYNKGALMLLPPGTSKGTGLERLLELCGFSTRNLVSFGDGENDLSLFQVSETGITVADGVPSLQAIADYVAKRPGPDGIIEALERFWLNGRSPVRLTQRDHPIVLGKDDNGEIFHISGAELISQNLGIFGDSGSGKSWVTGLLAEGMHLAGYQILIIDPEGDFRGLRSLPGIISLSGNESELPPPSTVITFLAEASISIVLELCHYPMEQRILYVTDLLKALRPLKEHKFRPHWIVLEEAQQFLPPHDNMLSEALLPMLENGGWVVVSFRPDRLTPSVTAALNHCLVARLSDPEAVQAISQLLDIPENMRLEETPQGSLLMCGARKVRLRPAARRVPHIRHLYKYLDTPLPRQKRFYFYTPQKPLSLEAANLFEFKELLPSLPLESLDYHLRRGDFAAWVRKTLDDDILATHLEKLANRTELSGEALRQALHQRVSDRYQEIHSLR